MGRSDEFSDGVETVRAPKFQSVQQQANRHFAALSVLDNVIPNQNGMGQVDLQRRIMGRSESTMGRSQETFDRQLWLQPQSARRSEMMQERD